LLTDSNMRHLHYTLIWGTYVAFLHYTLMWGTYVAVRATATWQCSYGHIRRIYIQFWPTLDMRHLCSPVEGCEQSPPGNAPQRPAALEGEQV
jgi:hypothetical protein